MLRSILLAVPIVQSPDRRNSRPSPVRFVVIQFDAAVIKHNSSGPPLCRTVI